MTEAIVKLVASRNCETKVSVTLLTGNMFAPFLFPDVFSKVESTDVVTKISATKTWRDSCLEVLHAFLLHRKIARLLYKNYIV